METMPPSSASDPEFSSNFDEFSIQRSLLFSDSLMDLKELRSQLYSAAEYFEQSYTNNDQKQMMVDTLKEYAVKALVNTIDHLGSVSSKVNGLLDEKVDDVSGTEFRMSCIEQRLQTCKEYIDHEGLSQQALVITAPKYHKRYILPVGESMPGSGKLAAATYQESDLLRDDGKSILQAEVYSTLKDRPPSFRKARSPSASPKARSSSPSGKMHFSTPSPGIFSEKRAISPIPRSKLNTLLRSGSLSGRPSLPNTYNAGRQLPSELQKSTSFRFDAQKDYPKEAEKKPSKSNRLLKALLSRRKSRKDDVLNSYLDEY